MVGTHHRPSDDISVFAFLTPGNAMLSVELAHLKDILTTSGQTESSAYILYLLFREGIVEKLETLRVCGRPSTEDVSYVPRNIHMHYFPTIPTISVAAVQLLWMLTFKEQRKCSSPARFCTESYFPDKSMNSRTHLPSSTMAPLKRSSRAGRGEINVSSASNDDIRRLKGTDLGQMPCFGA
jgi:hypothetical protein